ncbi:hypothetical protein H072_1280 [Dactylellina haptotyla CBS 200.50]|uniref:Rhomboid-type serine protease n=1 Tax=Dactylellina haptotyla (strain CBS 200.50) TaxID=1284197 RepID=S8BZ44_DACHA|nr:hypothetical protein H072_1280 [Dactylellina haptotyla CBS 200.50]
MAAYDYYNPANRTQNQTPLSAISPPGSNPSPYRNETPYNPSLDDVRTTYKPSQDPYSYSPQEDTSYHGAASAYDNRRYSENIPLSEHPQHMAGATHQPAYPMNSATLPQPVPPMREKGRQGFWARRRAKKIPFFCYIVSLIDIAVFIAEIVKNAQLTGSPIQTKPTFNPMIGPSPYVMINMGARFIPCMKDQLTIGSAVANPWPCPNATTSTFSTDLGNICTIQELCGFSNFTTPDQWWRFIIPMFMHAGLIHIGFNLLIQLTLGADMEREIGIVRFAIVYIASGIFGFVLGGNFAPQGLASTGASGALFGILALVLLDLFYTWKQRPSPWKDLIFLLIDFAISFVLGLLPGIDNFAHIGGVLMGLALGLAFLRSPPALQSKLGNMTDTYNSMTSAAIQNLGLRRLVKDPVGFFRGRNPFWWVWWFIRAAFLTLAIVAFILLLRNFYIYNQECKWCRYFTCLPVSNWCEIGNLAKPTTTPARESPRYLKYQWRNLLVSYIAEPNIVK